MTTQQSDTQHPALVVTGLAARASEVPLLENVSLTVDRARLVGLTGPSGCGKTTLLRTIAGLTDAPAGLVQIDNTPPADIGWPAFRRRVVLVDQQPVLFDGTVQENLARPFTYRTARGPFPLEHAKDLLERAGLGAHRLTQAAPSLSVGQQQRACLVRALLIEPDFLLLDEPTAALDAENVSIIEQLIRDEATQHNIGVLIVTHDHAQVARWCDEHIDLSAYQAKAATEVSP